jgi:hypothetical protein
LVLFFLLFFEKKSRETRWPLAEIATEKFNFVFSKIKIWSQMLHWCRHLLKYRPRRMRQALNWLTIMSFVVFLCYLFGTVHLTSPREFEIRSAASNLKAQGSEKSPNEQLSIKPDLKDALSPESNVLEEQNHNYSPPDKPDEAPSDAPPKAVSAEEPNLLNPSIQENGPVVLPENAPSFLEVILIP